MGSLESSPALGLLRVVLHQVHWCKMPDDVPARGDPMGSNPMGSNPERGYRFGVFEADAGSGELRRQGIRLRLNAQPFQLLMMLLERSGEVVTREEICARLWPDGTFVDYEHGVNSAVNRIREALGDNAANPRFVE